LRIAAQGTGHNAARLGLLADTIRIRAAVDPDNLIRSNHPIAAL